MTAIRTIVVCALWTVGALAIVSAQTARGIEPLTQETAQAAVNEAATPEPEILLPDGKRVSPAPTPNFPTLIKLQRLRREQTSTSGLLTEIGNIPFESQIVTPYVVVMGITRDALRNFVTPQYPSLETLNAGLVKVVVSPGNSLAGDVIESLVVKRDDQIVRPLKSNLLPTMLSNALGAKKKSAQGTFTFGYATFTPDRPITIVLVGRARNFEWTMSPEELIQLK